jgi:hypothetical protein
MMMNTVLVTAHLLLIAMGIGLSLSNFINTRLALKNGAEFAKGLGLQRRTIARMADGVIVLIWLSGLVLLAQRGSMAGLGGAFHLKLLAVVALTVFHGLARYLGGQMQRAANFNLLPRQSQMILGVFLSAILALICAELAFRG